MIKLLAPLPKNIVIALSGGVDSVAVCDFLSRKHDVTAAFYHHGTPNSEKAYKFVSQFCTDRNIPLMIELLRGERNAKQSPEEFWREKRYEFLDSLGDTLGPIITGHHLDDSVENFLFGAINGTPKLIPFRRNNILRPFLTTRKYQLVDWCERHSVKWCEDLSNNDLRYTRNRIRHKLLPEVLAINPGIHKTVKRMIEYKMDESTHDSPSFM